MHKKDLSQKHSEHLSDTWGTNICFLYFSVYVKREMYIIENNVHKKKIQSNISFRRLKLVIILWYDSLDVWGLVKNMNIYRKIILMK